MKIFNWVHRRFNNKAHAAAENAKKNGDIAAGDEQFPAENKCDVVWRGGILAIGTFGYDPLRDGNQEAKDDYFFEEADEHGDDSGNDEDGDEPLVLVDCDFNEGELTEAEENTDHCEDSEVQFGFEYVMMKKKERTTLADLFVVDSGKDRRGVGGKRAFEKPDLVGEKSGRKCAPSSAGKLAAKDGHRPIHKLNKVMRRMMRRKIHPDVGPMNPKVATLNEYNNKSRVTDDCAALLPTQE